MKFFKSESAVGDAKAVVERRLLKLFRYDEPKARYVQKTSGYFNFFEILSALGIGTTTEQLMLGNILETSRGLPSVWFQFDPPFTQMDSVSKVNFALMVDVIANSDCHIAEQEPGSALLL